MAPLGGRIFHRYEVRVNMWLLLGIVVATLYCFWLMFRFTFDLIDRAHEELRQQRDAELRLEAVSPDGEKAGS